MNILITSLGRSTYVIDLFKDAVGSEGKVFASNSVMTSSLLKADGYVITPLIYDPSYIGFISDYCRSNKITAILSWFDIDLLVLAKHKEQFRRDGITVLVPDESVIRLCNDKWNTCLFLASLGIKQPKTYVDLALLKQDLHANKLAFPLIFKPRWGLGSIALYQVDSFDELDVIYQRCHREIFSSFVKYESEQNRDECIIMQEKVIGDEYVLDVFNDLDGNYVTSIVKRKFSMRFGETDIGQVIDSDNFRSLGKLIGTHLKLVSNSGVDCFLTKSGDIIVLEINPRFTGHYPFSHLAGTHFPKQIVDWLRGYPTSEINLAVNYGVKGVKEFMHPVRF